MSTITLVIITIALVVLLWKFQDNTKPSFTNAQEHISNEKMVSLIEGAIEQNNKLIARYTAELAQAKDKATQDKIKAKIKMVQDKNKDLEIRITWYY